MKTKLFVIISIIITLMLFTACIDDNKVTLSFNVNGGEELPSVAYDENAIIKLPEPIKGETTFLGWFLDEDHTIQVEKEFTLTENTIIHAKWQEETPVLPPKTKIDITFTMPDGSNIIQTIDNNILLSSYPVAANSGYELLWYKDASFSKSFNNTIALDDDLILYGKWTPFFVLKDNVIISVTDYGKTQSELTIPTTIDNIEILSLGDNCFMNCPSLHKLTISKNINDIGNNIFLNNKSLIEIFVDKDNEFYNSIDGVLFNKDKNNLIAYPKAKTSWLYKIPEGTTTISKDAFGSVTNIGEVLLPSTMTCIQEKAFQDCTAIITLSKGITEISKNAFTDYAGKHINLSDIKSIGDYAFRRCFNLNELRLPSSLQQIGECAFAGGTFPIIFANGNSMSTVQKGAFRNYDYNEIKLPNSIKTIEDDAFRNSSIRHIILPESLVHIGRSSFQNCVYLESIQMPNTTITIGSEAFSLCSSLTDISISSTLEAIGERGFYGCKQLRTISLPKTLLKIDLFAFTDCDNLEKVFILSKSPPKLNGALCFPRETMIYVTDAELYQKDTDWSYLYNKMNTINKEDTTLGSCDSVYQKKKTR